MFITFFVFIIILSVLYYKYNYNRNYTYIVKPLIINRPTSTTFKNSINDSRVTVFTDVLHNTNINEFYSDRTRQQSIIAFFNQFYTWNTPVNNFKMVLENINTFSGVKIVMNDLYIKTIIKGSQKLLVFNKIHHKELDKYINSDLNIWEDNTIKIHFDYVELTLNKGDMIYIPYGWLYAEYNLTDTVSIEKESDTLIRPVINKWVKDK